MRKENFKKGMKVYLYAIGNEARRRKPDKRIIAGTVKTVGTKYLTVDVNGWEHQFDMKNDFKEKTEFSREWILYLSEEDIRKNMKEAELHNWFCDRFQNRLSMENFKPEYSKEALSQARKILIADEIRRMNWVCECDMSCGYSVMAVQVGFSHADNEDDETELNITAYNSQELAGLFMDFCEENGFKNVKINSIYIVRTAVDHETLTEMEGKC